MTHTRRWSATELLDHHFRLEGAPFDVSRFLAQIMRANVHNPITAQGERLVDCSYVPDFTATAFLETSSVPSSLPSLLVQNRPTLPLCLPLLVESDSRQAAPSPATSAAFNA